MLALKNLTIRIFKSETGRRVDWICSILNLWDHRHHDINNVYLWVLAMQVFLFSSLSCADRFLAWVMTGADGSPHGISPGLGLLGDPKDFAQSRGQRTEA